MKMKPKSRGKFSSTPELKQQSQAKLGLEDGPEVKTIETVLI